MSGPTFSFWYAQLTDAHCGRLEAIARKLARSFRRLPTSSIGGNQALLNAELSFETASGLIWLHVDRHADDHYPAHVRAAFEAELGFAPLFEIGGYCAAKDPADWDALRVLAQHIVAAFGGLIVQEANGTEFPDLPRGVTPLDPAVREVVARNEAHYFGPMASDLDYVRRHRDAVPVERYWVIDAAVAPTAWVGR